MQIVDVLRDHRRRLAGTVDAREPEASAPGPGGGKLRTHGNAPRPGFSAHLLTGNELVERDRLVLGPKPAGRAEVRDAALRGNAGTREGSDQARPLHQILQLVDGGLEVGR